MSSLAFSLAINLVYYYLLYLTSLLHFRGGGGCNALYDNCMDNRKSHIESCGKIRSKYVSDLSAAALFFALGASQVVGPQVLIQ
jgi:hypothetical protein